MGDRPVELDDGDMKTQGQDFEENEPDISVELDDVDMNKQSQDVEKNQPDFESEVLI